MDHDTPYPRRMLFLHALRSAAGKAAPWLFSWFVVLLFSLAAAAPWVAWYGGALAHRYAPGEVLAGADVSFRFDQRKGLAALDDGTARTVAVLSLLAMLWGVFSAGGWLQIFLERAKGSNLRRFLWGGAKYFGRFLRVWLLTLLLLGLVSWLMHGWLWNTVLLDWAFGAKGGDLESFRSELTVARLEWLQSALYATLFALVLVWGDYTRTRLAMHDTRSAVWAGLCSLFFLLRHPVRTLRPFALILALEVLVVWCAGWLSWRTNINLDGAGWRSVLFLFLLGQVPLLWQSLSRGARYHAAVQVSRWLVPPLSRPDPWPRRIGGPGGPQYPIDDSDEYGVSI